MIHIKDNISIGDNEIVFRYSRSSKPGGQNVNKVSSRVTLLFDLADCRSLSDLQKQQIRKKLNKHFNKNGILSVTSEGQRSQRANRQIVIERFAGLLTTAIAKKKIRKKTKIPRLAHEKRLQDKKRRSIRKQQRTKTEPQ